MVQNEFNKIKDMLVEQKITKQVTVADGAEGKASITIPDGKRVFLKGYGYTYFSGTTYTLSTGNRTFPNRTDQEGSIAQPMVYSLPFPCRAGSTCHLNIANGTGSSQTYEVVFYIMTEDHLEEVSTGGEIIQAVASGAGSTVTSITNSAGTLSADVVARGDGKNALCVDTELTIHGATFVVDNVNVASTDGTAANSKYILCETSGEIHTIISDATNTASVNADGTLNVKDSSFSGGGHAAYTVLADDTAEQLASQACRTVRLRASTLTGTAYIGFSNAVNATKYFYKLSSTNDYVDIPVSNTDVIWVYAKLGDVIEQAYNT